MLIAQGRWAAGRAHLMAHGTPERNDRAFSPGAEFEGEIDVFAAVDKGFVESADGQKVFTPHEAAGGGDGEDFAQAADGFGQGTEVFDFPLSRDTDAGVVKRAVIGAILDVADQTGAPAETGVGGEHRLKPARGEHEVVVEQRQELAAGDGRAAIIGGGETEVALVEHDAKRRVAQGRQPVTRAVGTAVVDQNDFVGETGRKRGLQARHHRLRERQAVVEGNHHAKAW